MSERCKHDLPIDGCGYCSPRPTVVGIRKVEAAEARKRASRRTAADFAGQWSGVFAASFAGTCAVCGERFAAGTPIRRLLGATGCAEETCVTDDE